LKREWFARSRYCGGQQPVPAKAGNAHDHAGVGLPSRRHCPPFLVVGADKLRKLDVQVRTLIAFEGH